MSAREVACTVTSKIWISPTVFMLGFSPARRFSFEPGQFLSIILPVEGTSRRRLRRIYSLACSHEQGYELCIKDTGGPGPSYLASLNVGDIFRATAPHGEFIFRTPPDRRVCFISTGTGIAPFRAMMMSSEFRNHPPSAVLSIFGARHEKEIILQDELSLLGVECVVALSDPTSQWRGFWGRVSSYLENLPARWPWASTDFYLCGNGRMIAEVLKFLTESRGVRPSALFHEAYFDASSSQIATLSKLRKAA